MNVGIFVAILLVAVLVEALIETLKIVIAEPSWEHAVAFIIGGGLAFMFQVPFIDYLPVELAFNGLASQILSAFFVAVLIVRYSGKINDLLEFLKYLKSLGQTL